jgi:hypothetical protein
MTRVFLYPGDNQGCGKLRMIWPAAHAERHGADVTVELPNDRRLRLGIDGIGHVGTVNIADGDTEHLLTRDDADVVILQRPTHQWLAEAVPVLRGQGVAVIVDIDDDLSHVHPQNVAWIQLQADRYRHELILQGYRGPQLKEIVANAARARAPYRHSYLNLEAACRDATLVTCSTARLTRVYAKHGRGRVLPNYLPEHYYGHPRVDSPNICWPASIHNHPDDPGAVGNALARVLRETGVEFTTIGEHELTDPIGRHISTVGKRFGLPIEPQPRRAVPIDDWPGFLAGVGIGICPLAQSTFNASKSWLKPLELSAAGVPWIGSPRAEYRRLHDLGCGLLAEGTADWYRLLRELIKSESRRAELSEQGRAIAGTLRLADHIGEHMQAWEDASNADRGAALAHSTAPA